MTWGLACRHRLWTAHTVERRRAWHDITAFGQHKHSNDVGCVMTSPPLDYMHSRTTSSVAFHHRVGAAHTVERHRTWHAIIAFGQHKRSNDVGRGMKSPPLDSTHDRTTSGVECHHRLWTAHTVERRRAWHAIIAIGKHTRSNNVRRGMPLSPLGSTNGRTTWGWHAVTALGLHAWSDDVGLGMTLLPLYSTHGRQCRA